MRNKKNQTKGIKFLNVSWFFKLNFCLSFIFFAFSVKVQAQSLGSGNCLNFNGAEHVTIGNAYSSMSLPVSISLWIKPNATGAQGIFYSSDVSPVNEGWWFQISPSGNLAINYGDGNGGNNSAFRRTGVNNIGSLAIGQWYHLAGVMRGVNDMDLYLNGIALSVSYTGSGGPISSSGSNGLIGLNNQNGWDLDAQIDEMSIWDRALTATEIRNLMCAKLQGNEPGLRGYYRFDATTGNTLTDFSTNGNNGTLVNNPTWVASTAPVGDRSNWSYSAPNTAIELSPNSDSAVVSLNGTGTNGLHVYFVDALPNPLPAGPLVPPSVNHYLGTFAADPNRTMNLEYHLNAPLTQPGVYQLAHRQNNAATSWALLAPFNNPIVVNNRSAEQYLITSICPPPPDVLPNDTVACDSLRLSIGAPFDNITWNDAVVANSRSFTQSGQYWFTATDTSTGCPVSDTVMINLLNTNNLQILPNDTLVCAGPPLALNAYNSQAIAYQWSTGSSDSAITVFTPGTYWVNLFFAGNCSVRDSIVVNFSEDIEPLAEDEFTFCDGEPVQLNLDPQKFITATWSNSQTGLQATYSSAGRYWVLAQKLDGCLVSDTFTLKPSLNFDTAKVFNDTTFCAGDFIRFKAPLEYEVLWPNGSDSTYYVSVPQSIKVTISDGCTTLDQFFDVRQTSCECDVIMPNAFTPNGDGLNDVFKPVTKCEYLKYELSIINRWGMQVFYTQSPGVGFDGTLNGEVLPGGTFIYKFNFNNGINEGTRTGTLVLIR